MIDVTPYTEFQAREVLSKTYELHILEDIEIRDTNAHNTDIADCQIYNYVAFFIINDLNQAVTMQIKGNRINSVSGAVDIGSSFSVVATDSGAKAIAGLGDGVLPYMFVTITAAVTPTSGDINCYALRRLISS